MKKRSLPLAAFALVAPLVLAADPKIETGRFAPGEAYAPPELQAPARESRAFLKTVQLEQGSAVVALPVGGGSRLIVWRAAVAPGPDGRGSAAQVATSLRLPSGEVFAAGEAESRDGGLRRLPVEAEELGLDLAGSQEALHVRRAEPGLHRLELVGQSGAVVTLVAAEPDSSLVLKTQAGPLSRQPGEPVTLTAALSDGALPLTGARVTARLLAEGRTGGKALELRDDGRSGDGAAGDGVYGLVLRGLPSAPAGLWSVRFEAAGHDGAGHAFLRTGGSGFVNEPGAAKLATRGASARVVGTGATRHVRVEADALVREAGRYRFDAIVAGAQGAQGRRPGRAWSEATQELAAGRVRLSLDVPLRESDPSGEALLVDLRLLGLDRPGLAGRVTLETR